MLSEKNQWIYNECNNELVEHITKNTGISEMLARILVCKGITDIDKVNEFLNPSMKDLNDPFLLSDMEKAAKRISDSVKNEEKILIYGDYDVDGITSTSLLYNFLKAAGAMVYYYIPDRIEEGYGLSISAIEKIIKDKTDLIITVDCGITSFNEVDYINERNIDIIITDHHECKEDIPNAHAVINPHRYDDSYPFKELAGVGVTFKLAEAVAKIMNMEFKYEDYLDFVALGTIADVVPLVGENRVIVKHGLDIIKNTKNLGLKVLIEKSEIKKEINTWTVSFILAPRINAAGRIGCAGRAVELFTTDDIDHAKTLVEEFIRENRYRQDTEQHILNEAFELINIQTDLQKDKVIVVCGNGWHHGVIGIVASKITEKYYKPCILLSNEDGISKGSARSIKGFNLFEALCACNDLLEKYGGHELAAGMTIKTENVDLFRVKINEYADKVLSEWDMIPKINIDLVIDKGILNIKTVSELNKLEPYGPGNYPPVFAFHSLKIIEKRALSEQKHLKMLLGDEEFSIDAIGFNMGQYYNELNDTDIIDAACYVEINEWNNVQKLQLNLKDIKINDDLKAQRQYFDSFYRSSDDILKGNANNHKSTQKSTVNMTSDELIEYYKDMINSGKSTLIIVNSLQSLKTLLNAEKELSIDIKKYVKVCYNRLDIDEFYTLNILVNPRILECRDIKNYNTAIFGSWLSSDYVNRILDALGKDSVEFINFNTNLFPELNSIVPERNDIAAVYQYIRQKFDKCLIIEDIHATAESLECSYKVDMNYFKFIKCLEILSDLALIKIEYDEKKTLIVSYLSNDMKKRNLYDSPNFRKLKELKKKF